MRTFERCPMDCTAHTHVDHMVPVDSDGHPLDTDGEPILFCIKRVSDGGRMMTTHECGKYLKGDPEFPHWCGVHVAAKRRVRSKVEQRDALKSQREEERDAASKQLCELNDELGIRSTLSLIYPRSGPDAWTGGVPTGKAVVEVEQLEQLAGRIRGLEAELRQLRNR